MAISGCGYINNTTADFGLLMGLVERKKFIDNYQA